MVSLVSSRITEDEAQRKAQLAGLALGPFPFRLLPLLPIPFDLSELRCEPSAWLFF